MFSIKRNFHAFITVNSDTGFLKGIYDNGIKVIYYEFR